MTEAFLEKYFKSVAIALKDLSHTDDHQSFYRITDPMNLDEFDNAVRNMQSNRCLLLEIGEGDIADWDSQREMPRIGLHALVKSTEAFDDIKAARELAKDILLKIVSKMRLDSKVHLNGDQVVTGPLKVAGVSFDSRIKFSNMGSIDGNWYGKSFYFDFKAPINLVYNENDWQ